MKLLSWGANTYGQLGHSIKSEQCVLPVEISEEHLSVDLSSIRTIVGGGGHTLLLNKCGEIYGCGWNTKGQLGLPIDSDTLKFQKVSLAITHYAIQVSCGWDASMAVTRDGLLLAWGSNSYGQLGVPKEEVAFSATPLEVSVPKVQFVSMGLRHCAMVTSDGRVLICGDGRKGQLGLVDKCGSPISQIDKPTEVPGLTEIQSVACGQYHTVASTSKGVCYVWGDNRHGQLGINPTLHPTVYTPKEMNPFLPNQTHTCRLVTGWTHTCLVNDAGSVVNWGRNTYGQLGSHEFERPAPWQPLAVDRLGSVTQLVAGSEHNLALTPDGRVKSWGWNEHGNCGLGTIEDVHVPTDVLVDRRYRTVLMGAGAGHSFAVVDF